MVSLSESELTEKQNNEAGWEHYEFWEKTEARMRRRRILIIAAAVVIFLGLSAIPSWMDLAPRWGARKRARLLAEQVSWMKTEAAVSKQAHRIRFPNARTGSFDFVIESAPQCLSHDWKTVREGNVSMPAEGFVLVSEESAKEMGIPGIIESFCYEPFGNPVTSLEANSKTSGPLPAFWGFGVISAKDLTEKRLERMGLLLLQGASGEIRFE